MSLDEHRDEILRQIKGAPDVGVTGLAERTGLDVDQTREIVERLVAEDSVRRDGGRLLVIEPAASRSDRELP